MSHLGGFEFGPSIVRVNSRYDVVASAWDTSLVLQDLTAFDAYVPMEQPEQTPTFTSVPTESAASTPPRPPSDAPG
jgi:hypothetical protein